MKSEDLESLIRRYVILGKKSPKGYEIVKCAYCNDYKVRGGFKFENGGVHYSCFNCSTSAGYSPTVTRHDISKKMLEVLVSFGIPEAEIRQSVAFNFFKPTEAQPDSKPVDKDRSPPSAAVELPPESTLISSLSSPWCEVGLEYLKLRKLEAISSRTYVSDHPKYEGRLIIPYKFRERIIYWQARSMDDQVSPRYKNPTISRDNIFYNMDEIYRYTDLPLFITEGALDAESIGETAIGIGGSVLSTFQHNELKKVSSRRKLVFVLDKNLNGRKLGQRVLEEGWSVTCFPDNITDSNDALKKMGKLWLVTHLTSTACSGFEGQLLLRMKCNGT